MLISNYNAIYQSSNNKISSKQVTHIEKTILLSTTVSEEKAELRKKSLIENYVIDMIEIISLELSERIEGKDLDLL